MRACVVFTLLAVAAWLAYQEEAKLFIFVLACTAFLLTLKS
jgi:hypothetical protein